MAVRNVSSLVGENIKQCYHEAILDECGRCSFLGKLKLLFGGCVMIFCLLAQICTKVVKPYVTVWLL